MENRQNDYFVLDIETVPLDYEKYESEENEEDRLKHLNPIDSRIVALGLRFEGKDQVFLGDDEKDILEKFWNAWRFIKAGRRPVGFSILNFDIPFIISRSLINDVKIAPFMLKEIIDLRDKINAYKYGKSRGKLKEYAKLLGIETAGMDGSEVAGLWKSGQKEKIEEYLKSDLFVTDELYKKCKELRILEIERW